MLTLSASEVHKTLLWLPLVSALIDGYRQGCQCPARHHHELGEQASLLLMPAWTQGAYTGVKLVTVHPKNASLGLSSIAATYTLFSGQTGQALAQIDGEALTHRRTAAASALGAHFLSRKDSKTLVMIGTGHLAPFIIAAIKAVRPSIQTVLVWGRNADKAKALASQVGGTAMTDLKSAVEQADIVSSATLASEPLIFGDWLQPGQHLDLVGSFNTAMTEADPRAIQRAQVFVDTRDGCLPEAGEFQRARDAGVFCDTDVLADATELSLNKHQGRSNEADITLFKHTGNALIDLYAAIAVYEAKIG